MTDLDKLCELLDSWEVPYAQDEEKGEQAVVVGDAIDRPYRTPVSPKVDGYHGFYTAYIFDASGQFLRVGAWE